VRTVAVAGASGIVGRGYLEHLEQVADGAVRVLALGRRPPAGRAGVEHLPVDLTQPEQVRSLAPALRGVTELVYAAVSDDADDVVGGWATDRHVDRNLAMLATLLDVLEDEAPALRHVLVLQGTKAYGTTLGRFDLPARETDRASLATTFYWAQEDHVRARQHGKSWHWTILRPTAVVGVAERCQINVVGSVAAYATLLRELGMPLRFPGTSEHAVWQMVDNHLVGRAIEWALTRPDPGNDIFNVSNGDATNWESVWSVVADAFRMQVGAARPLRLAEVMPRQAARWREIAARHRLVNAELAELASWDVMDGHMGRDHNSYVSTLKIRAAGFDGFRDSLETFADKLALMADAGLVPRY
jgi:nucleoside-diphosphate-sugar epimerase